MTADRFSRALTERVQRFSQELPRAGRGDVAGVHRARVASRRLREALPLAAWAGAAPVAKRSRRTVRRLTRTLGRVRELDVTAALLDEAASRQGWPAVVVTQVSRILQLDRRLRHTGLAAVITRPAVKKLMRGLRDVAR
ncbi:MAG: CHAD domain-containing protein [Acidobacteria bacterium]|nr:CHAD domain-containing protein [Acidobacteriota bacterium]